MPLPPPQSLGHRPLSTQTPEIPEYWRELSVKAPWRSTGASNTTTHYDANSHISFSSRNSAALPYDGNGNLTYDVQYAYAYDAENRICAIKISNTYKIYVYDADGNRIAKGNITPPSGTTSPSVSLCSPLKNSFSITQAYALGLNGEEIENYTPGQTWHNTNVWNGNTLIATYAGNYMDVVMSDWLGTRRAQLRNNVGMSGIENFLTLPYGDGFKMVGGTNFDSLVQMSGHQYNQEDNLYNFDARDYADWVGRFMSPDPGNIGVNRLNPQSWNAYSYSLNNPLSVTDPTGLYVCEDSTKCDSANDQAFAKSLADAQAAANKLTGDDQAAAQRAIDAYGAQGVDNGVNVRFDSNVNGGVTEVSGVANGNKSADNPTGQNINVTFNPNAVGGDFSGGLVGHEGSHVADASAWVASGFSPNMNPTNLTTEFNAYHVSFNIGNALLNMKAGPGGDYIGYVQVPPNGQVNWKKGDTFKVITPDLQHKIKQNYQNSNSPAFTKGAVLQP
jgi:RHS repeat-associated protein